MALDWFKFFVEEWDRTRLCSREARLVSIDLLCLAHKNVRRGYLQHQSGKPFTQPELAYLTGSGEAFPGLLRELLDAGVISASVTGVIYSPSMVREEAIRLKCSEAGRRGGGNPNLKGKPKGTSKGASKGASISPSLSSSPQEKQPEGGGSSGLEGGLGETVPAIVPAAPALDFAVRVVASAGSDCPAWFGLWAERHARRFGLRREDEPETIGLWWPLLQEQSEVGLEKASVALLDSAAQPKGRNEHPRLLKRLSVTVPPPVSAEDALTRSVRMVDRANERRAIDRGIIAEARMDEVSEWMDICDGEWERLSETEQKRVEQDLARLGLFTSSVSRTGLRRRAMEARLRKEGRWPL